MGDLDIVMRADGERPRSTRVTSQVAPDAEGRVTSRVAGGAADREPGDRRWATSEVAGSADLSIVSTSSA
jgi:hypothetical protein